MIFLTNEHVQQVLDMPTCLNAMEEAYRELNEGRAGYRPRIDFYVPEEPHYYRWGTMEGASRKLGVFAIRMKSDMLAWEEQEGFKVEDKYCMQRGTYCGLIFLLSTHNAEPLALMNDGFLQHMRVGACAGLGTKYLARKNYKVLAMIGSVDEPEIPLPEVETLATGWIEQRGRETPLAFPDRPVPARAGLDGQGAGGAAGSMSGLLAEGDG